MPTSKEYSDAKNIIRKYEKDVNEKLVIERTCAICNTNVIKPINPQNTDYYKQENGMWDGGTVERISFGYGSNLDTNSYYIGICDECMQKLVEDGLAINTRIFNQYTVLLTGITVEEQTKKAEQILKDVVIPQNELYNKKHKND